MMNVSAIHAGQVASAQVMQLTAMRLARAARYRSWRRRFRRIAVPLAMAAKARARSRPTGAA
jgi:hypothetical protein